MNKILFDELVPPSASSSEPLSSYPELLSVSQAAELFGLSRQTVRLLCAQGELPGARIGRRWYLPRAFLVERLGGVNRD
jgi:excisionase family DNA binding protein